MNLEMNFIASVIQGEQLVLEKVKPEYFNDPLNKEIYQELYSSWLDHGKVTSDGVMDKLVMEQRLDLLERYNNVSYLSYNVTDNQIKKFIDDYRKRELIKMLPMDQEVIESDIDQLSEQIINDINKLLDDAEDEDDSTLGTHESYLEYLSKPMDQKDLEDWKWPLREMNAILSHIHRKQLTTIAAKSGTGKTALVINALTKVALSGKKVLMISREMDSVQIKNRILANIASVDTNKFDTRAFTLEERKRVVKAAEMLKGIPLHINSRVTTVQGIKKRLRKTKADLLVIDYLQLVKSNQRHSNREQEVASISREIKQMTLEFGIPVIQLSQLNDEMKDERPRGDRPMRESKAIYHDSDNVIYLHKPSQAQADYWYENKYYHITEKDNTNESKLIEVIVDKHRNGRTGMVPCKFIGKHMRFENCTRI